MRSQLHSAYPLEVGAYTGLGLVERDDYDEDDINHRQLQSRARRLAWVR
jgi:hypothetical protein